MLSGYHELQALRPAWQALCDRCPASTPFQRPDWLLPWIQHLGPTEPWILAVHSAEHLVGLAPLFRYERKQDGRWQRVLALLGAGTSDHLDLLIEPGHEPWVLAAILAELRARRADWDVCELDEQQPCSPLAAGAPLPGRSRDWVVEIERRSVCPRLPLPPRVEQLGQHVPASHLQRFRQYQRRARREGALRLERAGNGNRARLLDGLFRLHALRWQQSGQPGVLAQPPLRALHVQVAEQFAARDALALYGLWLDDWLIACLYGFFEAGTLYFYISGFDPAAGYLNPGTLILGMVLEDAIERGMTQFDFLRGSEPYKYWWGATDRDNVRVSLRWSGAADAAAVDTGAAQLTPAHAGADTGRDIALS
jgi:CelD/BcsL family acetyltransferase involved in cellulose biosynthesis